MSALQKIRSRCHAIVLWVPLSVSLLSGCDNGTPQRAKEDATYHYVFCRGTVCSATARFKELGECEKYREGKPRKRTATTYCAKW